MQSHTRGDRVALSCQKPPESRLIAAVKGIPSRAIRSPETFGLLTFSLMIVTFQVTLINDPFLFRQPRCAPCAWHPQQRFPRGGPFQNMPFLLVYEMQKLTEKSENFHQLHLSLREFDHPLIAFHNTKQLITVIRQVLEGEFCSCGPSKLW